MNADGTNVVNRTQGWSGSHTGPSWSSDGKYIVFASTHSGASDVWSMLADTLDAPTNITGTAGDEVSPAMGPPAPQKGFSLSQGYNLISLPFSDTGLATAEDLCNSIPNCSGVWQWNGTTQTWSGHPKGAGFNNFALVPGAAYLVYASASGTSQFQGTWASPTFSLASGYNLISLPESKAAIATAEALAGDVPNCTGVWRWDSATQNWVGHPKGAVFNNYAVTVGDAFLVYVTAVGTYGQ